MSKRRSNKSVKRMICNIRDKNDGVYAPFFGHYYDSEGLCECFPCGWGPDNYTEDFARIKQGTISLTASELKKGGAIIDRNGRIIKVGMKIKHIHHSQIATVHWKNGDLYAGNIPIATYHSSVIEIVD